jgi:gliding motility-associated-like protein
VIDSNAFCASAATAIHAVINEVPEKPRLGRDTALCPGQSIVLNAGAYDSYLWQDGSTSSIITANSTGIYTVSVKNSGVCAALDTIAVVILENCDDIYFPKAFSPNNDGNNERFGALGNVFLVKDFSMKIFNRQGQMVYSSFNVYQRWDGTINGVAQATGNFVYVASYVYKGSKRIQKGNLVLIR